MKFKEMKIKKRLIAAFTTIIIIFGVVLVLLVIGVLIFKKFIDKKNEL